jgi:hypothetical protein
MGQAGALPGTPHGAVPLDSPSGSSLHNEADLPVETGSNEDPPYDSETTGVEIRADEGPAHTQGVIDRLRRWFSQVTFHRKVSALMGCEESTRRSLMKPSAVVDSSVVFSASFEVCVDQLCGPPCHARPVARRRLLVEAKGLTRVYTFQSCTTSYRYRWRQSSSLIRRWMIGTRRSLSV